MKDGGDERVQGNKQKETKTPFDNTNSWYSGLGLPCMADWQLHMLPRREPGVLINHSCDLWPSAPDRWVARRQSSTGVFATYLHQKAMNQKLLTFALAVLDVSTM